MGLSPSTLPWAWHPRTAAGIVAAMTATIAGPLRHARDDRPGFRRRRSGRGFSYRDLDDRPIRDTEVLARVNVSPRMRIGCVWMPLHFGEANVNYVTNDAGDPITNVATASEAVAIADLAPWTSASSRCRAVRCS